MDKTEVSKCTAGDRGCGETPCICQPLNWCEVAEYAQGTCKSEADIAATFGMTQADEDRISRELAEFDLTLCLGCGWWVETYEMGEVDGEEYCSDCQSE